MSEVQELEITEKVCKESYELVSGLDKFVGAVTQALSDGWQPAQDIPVIISSAVIDLVPAIQGADKISAEYAQKPESFMTGILLGAKKIAFRFVK